MLLGVSVAGGMEIGAGGVWDSPMATDYWVKRFGFMWAGGRSGMYGLKALQVSYLWFYVGGAATHTVHFCHIVFVRFRQIKKSQQYWDSQETF